MRLIRHLSFSNVIAMLALFIALGGAAYAGTKISGSQIKNASIGGGKLKNETITGDKIKKGTITGAQIQNQSITGAQIQNGSIDASQINLTTLGTVPSAQTAQTANKAETANKADSATSATTATTATNAENAKHADSADTATKADSATNATNAATAGEADKLNGKTAAQLTLGCKTGTSFYGGMCWDQAQRTRKLWIVAVHECGELGGRLPTLEELVAYVLQEGTQVEEQTWSGDVDSLDAGKKEVVFTTDENGRSTEDTGLATLLRFRCVFPQSN